MGTDVMPPLPPINRSLSRGMSSGGDDANQSGRHKKNNNKQELSMFNKIFGAKMSKKKEAEEAKNLLNFYDNFEKDLSRALEDLLVDKVEQRSWLNLWVKIDPRRTNMMGFSSFCEVFSMNIKCVWSKRVYEIMNSNYTSGVSFTEFVIFCTTYLVLDEDSLVRFTFRLLSRRGTSDDKTIVDMQDIKSYLKFKFKKTLKKCNFDKLSLEVLKAVEQIPDYGIRPEDIAAYSKRNPSIIAFANGFLTHLRMCVFGYFFWVERSQHLKKRASSGLSSMGFLKNANIGSQRLISSLHKIHDIKTRVPKQFRADRKKRTSEQDAAATDGSAAGAGIPLEINLGKSISSDSAEHASRKSGKSGKSESVKSAMRSRSSKEGAPSRKKESHGKSAIAAARQSVDPNLFKVEDDSIAGDLDSLLASNELVGDDELVGGDVEVGFASAGGGAGELSAVDKKDLAQQQPQQNQQQRVGDMETAEAAVVVDRQVSTETLQNQSAKRSSRAISRNFSRQGSRLGSSASLLARQVSRQLSRQLSRLSRSGEEEADEETAEEKAARVESLRYYPIGFNIDQLLNTTFEKDFPDLVAARAKLKNDKIANMRDKLKVDLISEQRTYSLMTQVLDDLVTQKRGKRMAFGRWLHSVDMLDSSCNPNYRILFKPAVGPEAVTSTGENDDKKSKNDNEDAKGKFGFGMFGKKKRKAAAARAAAEETEQGKQANKSGSKEQIGHQSSADKAGRPDGRPGADSGEEDPEFAVHRRIVQMTGNLQDNGVDDSAFNEYMDAYRARCLHLLPDRTRPLQLESGGFVVTLKHSTEDTAKRVVEYGGGVEFIARQLYLPGRAASAFIEDASNR